MPTLSDVRPLEPDSGPPRRDGLSPLTVRRLVGVLLVVIVVAGFFAVTGFPRLDEVREEVAISAAVDVARAGVPADQVSNCFQGFCFEDEVGFAQRWWDFSTIYLRLIWGGLLLAIAVAAIVDGFLFPSGRGPAFGTWATADLGSRAERSPVSLLPVSGRGATARGIAVGGLAAPALALTVVLFSPLVWTPRLGLALIVVGAALWVLRHERRETQSNTDPPETTDVLRSAGRDTVRAAWRFAYRLVPLFVAVAFLGGLLTQVLTVDGVEAVGGAHVTGVLLAVAVGLLIDLPLGMAVPVAALALLVGVDPVIAGVLLVSLSIAGPWSFRSIIRSSGTAVAGVLVLSLVVGSLGTFAVASAAIEATGGPIITWDGETCSYRGPDRFGPQVHDFRVRNATEDDGDGHTLAIVVGKLPANVSVDHFAATVAADPAADLPEWFRVAGAREFVFPGDTEPAEITLHDAGTYAIVCLDGGGFYVIYEFSMPQPMGWFDEFRSTFDGHVAEQTFEVAG